MKFEVVLIILLSIVVGYLVGKLHDKRRQDIIKLLIKREQLPESGSGTRWLQNGSCYMSDGTHGIVKGNFCEQVGAL